jgi:hypothetical protein
MLLRKLMGIFAATLILGSASFAMAGVPDLALSIATGPVDACVLYNLPSGGGASFEDGVALLGGGQVIATINLELNDGLGAAVANYPFEDMWLESSNGGLVGCTGGTAADFTTNVDGQTRWMDPLRAGGSSLTINDLTVVMISGAALTSNGGFPIAHNSADINSNGIVNLQDVQKFAENFYGGYAFRSDLAFDGIVNLSDVVPLSQAMGGQCPEITP